MRILVVEDDRKVASFIRQGLVEEGHTVETAADGDRALELLVEGEPYDLIVLDVMLPGRDGFAVLKGARQAGVHAPVIMLTARDSVAEKVTGLDLGADDYLAKPFAFEELLARADALVDGCRRGDPAPGQRGRVLASALASLQRSRRLALHRRGRSARCPAGGPDRAVAARPRAARARVSRLGVRRRAHAASRPRGASALTRAPAGPAALARGT